MLGLNVSQVPRVLYPAHGLSLDEIDDIAVQQRLDGTLRPAIAGAEESAAWSWGQVCTPDLLQRSADTHGICLLQLLRLKMYISHREERIHQVAKAELPVPEAFRF